MAKKAKITVHPSFEIGEISDELFSAFLEPIGTMVNGTMFNPKHPTADAQGFRTDVIDALAKTGLPAVRLPGGNFVSAWQWKDSIGPKSERKVHLDPAWYQVITNEVGHDEYLQWAEKIGAKSLYTVNMGTGRTQDAMDCVEYTNFPGGTYWSDLRIKNGHEKPYGVKTWYLGNEMDGPWQLGSWDKDPRAYGVMVNETSKAMKWIDASIKTGVCGSSAPFMEHFPDWDEAALDVCYDTVDYLSVHHYHSAPPGDTKALLGGALYYEDYINTLTAMCDYVQSKHRSPKQMMISFDEYGGMVRPNSPLHPGWGRYNMARSHYRFNPDRPYLFHDPDKMPERRFPGGDLTQMLSMTSIQLALLRHADRVKIGCMTGGLGALCSSNHDNVWRSASHYAFMQMLSFAKGTSMKVAVESETYDMPGYAIDDTSQYVGKTNVPYVDSACAWDKKSGRLAVFVINRNDAEDYALSLDVTGFGSGLAAAPTEARIAEVVEPAWPFGGSKEPKKVAPAAKASYAKLAGFTKCTHYEISGDPEAQSEFGNDEIFTPAVNKRTKLADGAVNAHIKPLSFNVFVLE